MELTRRQLLNGFGGYATLAPVGVLADPGTITPEQFGARGDGATNDTAAFARMAAFVNTRNGGEIVLRRTTYVVGRQVPGGGDGYAFGPAPIMDFHGCTAPLVVHGNGARLRCAPGLRYGTFDPVTGDPTRHAMPYIHGGELAAPYKAMIQVERCSGPVRISDLELDGNMQALKIGGQYGDTGWQLPGSGIGLWNNSGPERLERLHLHHHPLDGLSIDGLDAPRSSRSTISEVRCDHNGRQGCSITGGRGYDFADCQFEHTGKSRISSAPGAGVDVEAEAGKSVRDLSFTRCRFSDNAGPGVVADSGPSDGARFVDCTFVGTTGWAAWPKKPHFRFSNCTFVGAIVHAYGDADPTRACRFFNCRFIDDPKLSPTAQVYGGANPSRPIADLPGNPNVLFERCDFDLRYDCVLPWTTNVVIFANCVMNQHAAAMSYPRGTFIGRNLINGNVNLYSAKIRGELILNGKPVPPTP